jgi:hypothetical protein
LLFDRSFVEADVFWAYSALLQFVLEHDCYEGSVRVDIIQALLPRFCPELGAVLRKYHVSAGFYMIHWIRVLFARVVHIDDVVPIWSGIFAHYPSFDFVHHLAICYLLLFKDKLVHAASQTGVLEIVTRDPAEMSQKQIAETIFRGAVKNSADTEDAVVRVCEEMNELIEVWDNCPTTEIIKRIAMCSDAFMEIEERPGDILEEPSDEWKTVASAPELPDDGDIPEAVREEVAEPLPPAKASARPADTRELGLESLNAEEDSDEPGADLLSLLAGSVVFHK